MSTEIMKNLFASLLRHRLDGNNIEFEAALNKEKQRLNARGLLHSSLTIEGMKCVLEAEFKHSAEVIQKTAIDIVRVNQLQAKKEALNALCQEALKDRKTELEAIYTNSTRPVEAGLLNKAMLGIPALPGQLVQACEQEMLISLSDNYDKLIDSRGTLASQVKSRFFNRPIIVWGLYVLAALSVLVAAVQNYSYLITLAR